MSVKGLIGIALICITAIVIVVTQTGPRAVYWRSMFGTHYPDAPTRIVQRGPNGERWTYERFPKSETVGRTAPSQSHWIDRAVGRASGVVEYDRTTLILGVTGQGRTVNLAMLEISTKRRRLEREIAAAGFEYVGVAELDVRSGRRRAEGSAVVARLEVSFEQGVDVLALLSRPEFEGLGNVAAVSYLHSDINGAIAHLKEAALARAHERAATVFDGLDWRVERVEYKLERTRLRRKSKYRQVYVNVAAVLQIRGTGARLSTP